MNGSSKTIAPALCAAGLIAALSGCNGPPNESLSLVQQTRDMTRAACLFEPTANTIIQILAKENPALLAAGQISAAICELVLDRQLSGGGARAAPMYLEGVQIEGEFVE